MDGTWMRTLGRRTAIAFPRAVKLFQHPTGASLGRGIRRLLKFLAIVGMLGLFGLGAIALLIGLANLARKQGWTAQSAVDAILGVGILAFLWISSWPGYVWVGLGIILALIGISTRLAALNYNVYALTEAVRGLKEQRRNEDDAFDDDFDEDEDDL
jgi:hypothetical protein